MLYHGADVIKDPRRHVSATGQSYRNQKAGSMAKQETLHASAVALNGKGVLILGRSGAGKSSLALEMMAYGCQLIADDRVLVWRENGKIIADAPAALSGLIEARGVGLLNASPAGPTRITLICDLDQSNDARLPPAQVYDLMDIAISLVTGPLRPHLGMALRQYLLAGRRH